MCIMGVLAVATLETCFLFFNWEEWRGRGEELAQVVCPVLKLTTDSAVATTFTAATGSNLNTQFRQKFFCGKKLNL